MSGCTTSADTSYTPAYTLYLDCRTPCPLNLRLCSYVQLSFGEGSPHSHSHPHPHPHPHPHTDLQAESRSRVPTVRMYPSKPTARHSPKAKMRQLFPRHILHPCRLIIVAVVLLLFFFLRFDGTSSSAKDVRNAVFGVSRGFRSLDQSRIAMITFTTEQKSYTHLSLKNKARTLCVSCMRFRAS